MTICPIALVVGCKKCLVFKICPLKTVIGDMPKVPAPEVSIKTAKKPRAAARTTAPRTAAPRAAAPRTAASKTAAPRTKRSKK